MKNLTPLQHCAHELRESFKRAEEEKQKMQFDKYETEGKNLVNKFANSFSTLFGLLIGSDIDVRADMSTANPLILLTLKDNQVSISLDNTNNKINSWRLFEKVYKSTMPNKDFGIAADREDEQRLIIAIEELLFNARPKAKEPQVPHRLQTNGTVYESLT